MDSPNKRATNTKLWCFDILLQIEQTVDKSAEVLIGTLLWRHMGVMGRHSNVPIRIIAMNAGETVLMKVLGYRWELEIMIAIYKWEIA